MPPLKQLTCQVEWAISNVPFDEYATTYWDGIVQCYLPAPRTPTPFSISVKSEGFIASGLAVVVFIDGIYQCNRNRCGLGDPRAASSSGRSKSKCSVEFRLRQQEQCLPSGKWLGREWRFQPGPEGPSVSPDHSTNPAVQSGHQGSIDVFVLRCVDHNGDGDNDDQFYRTLFPEFTSSAPRSPESGTCPLEQLRNSFFIGQEAISEMESVQDFSSFDGLKEPIPIPRNDEGRSVTSALPVKVPSYFKGICGIQYRPGGRLPQKDYILRDALDCRIKHLGLAHVTEGAAEYSKHHNTSLSHYQCDGDGEEDHDFLKPPGKGVDGDRLSHSVGYGRVEDYIHTRTNPEYLDTLKKPYARFVFKYRAQEIIERMFHVNIRWDDVARREHLKSLTKTELIEKLLQAERGLIHHNQATFKSNGSHTSQRWQDVDSFNNKDKHVPSLNSAQQLPEGQSGSSSGHKGVSHGISSPTNWSDGKSQRDTSPTQTMAEAYRESSLRSSSQSVGEPQIQENSSIQCDREPSAEIQEVEPGINPSTVAKDNEGAPSSLW